MKAKQIEWRTRFTKRNQEKGQELLDKGRVVGLKIQESEYTASVLDGTRREVRIVYRDGKIIRMVCGCPKSIGGMACEHMAAVLQAVELQQWSELQKEEDAKLTKEYVQAFGGQPSQQEGGQAGEKADLKAAGESAAESAEAVKAEDAVKPARRKRRTKEEIRLDEGRKAAEKLRKQEEERREAKRREREERKAERTRKEEEKRQQAQALRQKELEKQQAEEARRAEIRRQKEEEARRKEQKRRQEEENQRLMAARKQQEEKKRQEEAKRQEEKRCREEETKRAQETVMKKRMAKQSGVPKCYQYFDTKEILCSMKIRSDQMARGQRLLDKGDVEPESVVMMNYDQNGEPMTELRATGHRHRDSFPVSILFSRNSIVRQNCRCPDCRYNYYSGYETKCRCDYVAALACFLDDYGQEHVLGDATNKDGMALIRMTQQNRQQKVISSDIVSRDVRLVPRLQRKGGELHLSFRVGSEKLFVVKNLPDFCGHVRAGDTDLYGSKTYINHQRDNFDEESRKWIHFLETVQQEEAEQRVIFLEKNYYDPPRLMGASVNLFGWRLDRFYTSWENTPIEYEDKDREVRADLLPAVRNPEAKLVISSYESKKEREFHGIIASGLLPEFYFGADGVYYIGEEHFCRVEDAYRDAVIPLRSLLAGGVLSVRIGRNYLADFYYKVLPELEEIFEVTESEGDKIRSYLPPQAKYLFYLDAEEDVITCRARVRYGDQEYSLLDLVEKGRLPLMDLRRDVDGEQQMLEQAGVWFPAQDCERDVLFCDQDEEKMLRVLEQGADELMTLGEVHATQRFRRRQEIRKVKLSVGVSLSGGLLDLSVVSEELSREELLDVLQGYREKKRYYRLKSGEYMNLEDDSLGMLLELMETMHLTPKELLLDHMQLPVYRTLYLDKLLEEHEAVYSKRDASFRSMVKGFKTVNDADFEVPASLDRIMRNYQKHGYKWLRTLESWSFGGILADDMGLGKTLQMIAVLLAAKQEGREGTSLVVTPASLVFNWGEELRRFAPELKVSLISGTQAERKTQIEAYRNEDVLVTSYDLLKRDIVYYKNKQFLYEVIDEAQYIKNHSTAAAKSVKVIHSQTRYALTGTPIENRLSELWSIFDYLMPGFLYGYDTFRKEMELPAVKYQDGDVMKRLQKMTGPFIMRRLKEQVLKDLPEKLEENRYVMFEQEQRQLYDGQLTHMRDVIARQDDTDFNRNRMQILAELTKLRQICCDPNLCFENYRGTAAKTEACLELIQSAMDGGHRILLFSQFTSMLDILKKRLDSERIPYYTITGETKKELRQEYVKRFNGDDTPLFLISLKAGGVGLNLTGADVVIHYDPWWNLAVQNQATDRAHRIGQTRKVTVYKLIVKGSIEEKIQELQEKKRDLAEQVIGGETGQLGAMSREDILALLEG